MNNRLFGLAIGFGLAAASTANAAYTWNNVQSWGGGYIPGVTFNSAGQAYIRTDVGGAYKWNAGTETWIALNDGFSSDNDMGSMAFAVDQANDLNVYTTGGLYTALSWCSEASVFSSNDGGASWTRHTLNSQTVAGTAASKVKAKTGSICLGGNDPGRGTGNRMAVKGKTIYLGTNQNGLLKSTDGGASWTTISDFDNTSGISAVAFDKNGNVYAAPYAGGLYKSTDGNKFEKVAQSFSGKIFQMSIAGDFIWITSNENKPLDQGESSGGHVHKYTISSGSITEVSMPKSCGSKSIGYVGISSTGDGKTAAVSTSNCWAGKGGPSSPDFVPGESLFYTTDGGSTWSEILHNSTFDAASAHSNATSNPHWISAVGINPTNADNIIFGTGYGLWSTNNATADKPTWKFTDNGIEETVPLAMVSTTYGAPLVSAVGDIDGYYHINLDIPMETRHQEEAGTNYDLDFAGKLPNKMIRIYKKAEKGLGAYSLDGGKTWKAFPQSALPSPYNTGKAETGEDSYAAISADGSTIVWNIKGVGLFYSRNNGAEWKKTSSNIQVSGFRVTADKVADKTFYIYQAAEGILYKTTDGGVNWKAVNSGLQTFEDWAYGNARVFASPDKAEDIYVTQGAAIYACDSPSNCPWPNYTGTGLWNVAGKGDAGLFHSTDGGSSLKKVSGVLTATYVGFGKGKTEGKSTLYIKGIEKTGIEGLFRSDDGNNWTKISDDKHNFGGVTIVIGDPCIYSRVYLGSKGRGMIYGEESGNTNSCKDREDGGSVPPPPADPSKGATNDDTAISTNFIGGAKFSVSVQHESVLATFNAATSGKAAVILMNGLGQVVAQQNVSVKAGSNSVQLKSTFRGPAFIIVKQGSQMYSQKVVLK